VLIASKHMMVMLTLIALLLLLYTYFTLPFEWLAVFTLTALLYGVLSPSIAARRLFFLATEAPHMSLFAIALGILLYRYTLVFNEFIWAVAVGVVLINSVGHLVRLGVDPDVATSVFVSLSASGSVSATYYILSRYSVQYNLWAVILGDPLLATQQEVLILAAVALAVIVLSALLYNINVYMGSDLDHVRLTLSALWLYDIAFYTILAVASVVLLKFVGFILEHVLLSLPAIIASNIASSSRETMLVSVLVSLNSSIIGLVTAVKLNIAPAASVGITALLLYIISVAVGR